MDQDRLLPFKKNVCKRRREGQKKEKIIEMEQHDSSVNRFARGGNKHQVLLLVIVSSAPGRCDRRKAIRQTWMSKCDTGKVVFDVRIFVYKVYEIQMYSIYADGCGEMK